MGNLRLTIVQTIHSENPPTMSRKWPAVAACFLFSVPTWCCGQTPGDTAADIPAASGADASAAEIRLGGAAQDFKLSNSQDRWVLLSDYRAGSKLGKEGRNVVLVFVRAHW